MAFTWEVEALRKMIDAIVGEAKWAEIGDVDDWQFDIDKKKVAEIDKSIEKRSPAIDAFMKALSNVPSDEAKRRKLEDEEEALEAYITDVPENPYILSEKELRGDYPPSHYDKISRVNRGRLEAETRRSHENQIEGILKKFDRYDEGKKKKDKLKLDWVNEILKEFPEDEAPKVLRLPHLKDEEKPDITPFLSYLLRQSPYARLPAAGLLGLGLMGYSKPAY